ncbi:RNA polymerase sigma factor [Paludibacter jiangxiensis]|nr:sigma-70 family RNA polymerase sigma factor [Paludibacter jiangxiensis]
MPNKKREFLALIQENKRLIFKICNTYCSNREDREDLAQEIVYQLWRSEHTYDAGYKFSTWMYRVALNVAISFYRSHANTGSMVSFDDCANDVENAIAEDTEYENEIEKNRQLLYRLIGELKELDRMLILLFLEAKSYKEIAEIAGITETNVATRINRIKEKLKQQITYSNN